MTRQQKIGLVIRLAEQGKSTRQIAEAVRISLKDIGTILRMYTGEDKEASDKPLSVNSRAFKLLKENKSLVDVAITLNIEAWEVLDRFNEYLQLSSKDKLMAIYREMGDDDIELLVYLYKELQRHGLDNRSDISTLVQQEEKLKNLDKYLDETAGIVGKLNFTRVQLERDVDDLVRRIDHYDSVLMEQYQKIYNNK